MVDLPLHELPSAADDPIPPLSDPPGAREMHERIHWRDREEQRQKLIGISTWLLGRVARDLPKGWCLIVAVDQGSKSPYLDLRDEEGELIDDGPRCLGKDNLEDLGLAIVRLVRLAHEIVSERASDSEETDV